jgi:hypothetical protein
MRISKQLSATAWNHLNLDRSTLFETASYFSFSIMHPAPKIDGAAHIASIVPAAPRRHAPYPTKRHWVWFCLRCAFGGR